MGRLPDRFLPAAAVLFVLLAAGCGRASEPHLERWVDGAFEPVTITAYEITGNRDGAATAVLALLALESGERLRLEFTVLYNPTPALGSGTWEIEGDGGAAGEVRAESIKFLGGQGEGPSVGGRFRLDENGAPRFRLVLPARPLTASTL